MAVNTHFVYKVWRRELNPNYALFSINVLVPTWLSWNADDKDGALMLWHRSWDMRVGFGRPQFMTELKIQHRRWPGRIYSQKISLRDFYIGKIYCQKGSVLDLYVVQIAAYWTSTDFWRCFEFRYIFKCFCPCRWKAIDENIKLTIQSSKCIL